MVTRTECERLLKFFRSYYLLWRPDDTFMPPEERRKIMSDGHIRYSAEEFVSANRTSPTHDPEHRYRAALEAILSPHGLDISPRIRDIAEGALSDVDYVLDGDYVLDDALSDSYTSPTQAPEADTEKSGDMQGES